MRPLYAPATWPALGMTTRAYDRVTRRKSVWGGVEDAGRSLEALRTLGGTEDVIKSMLTARIEDADGKIS